MKYFVLALCVLGTALAAPSSDNDLTASEEQFVNNFLQNYGSELDKYVKKSLKELAEAICENKSTDFEGPLEEVVRRAEEVDDQSGTVCFLVSHHLEHVLEPLTSAIDGCLPNDEAGVANYVVKAIVSLVEYICQSTGEQLLELANPCIDKIDFEENKCIENVAEKWNEITTVSKKTFREEACSEYNDVRPCFESAVGNHCKLSITKDSILGLFDSVFKAPCA